MNAAAIVDTTGIINCEVVLRIAGSLREATAYVTEGTAVENPAFDVTPNRYVTAIVTERGVARPPYLESLRNLVT